MEQTSPKIELETTTGLCLTKTEFRALYLRLALSQYHYDRKIDYNETHLIKQLDADFSKYLAELHHACAESPNNHLLMRVRAFFDLHHKHLQELVK